MKQVGTLFRSGIILSYIGENIDHSPWSMAYSLLRIVLRLCARNYDLYDILHGLWTMDHRPKQKSRHEDGISLKQTKQSKRPSLVSL